MVKFRCAGCHGTGKDSGGKTCFVCAGTGTQVTAHEPSSKAGRGSGCLLVMVCGFLAALATWFGA